MKKTDTQIKRKQIKKLTPNDLQKITGGLQPVRDCTGPGEATCIAYIVLR